MKTSITAIVLALFVGIASAQESYVELFIDKECCRQKRAYKKELIAELMEEAEIIPTLLGEGNTTARLLLDQQEEERRVDRSLRGRELQAQTNCKKACKLKPAGYWCLYVCNGGDDSDDRRLGSDSSDGDEVYVPTCVEYPAQVDDLLNRLTEKGVSFGDDCQLEADCLILRECV